MLKNFKIATLSLQIRIFVSMIILIIVASAILATISIFQFKSEAKEYHQEKLERKEDAIKENINYVLNNTKYALIPANLSIIFKEKIHELADIHNLEINIYSLKGNLVKSSKSRFSVDKKTPPIPKYVLTLVQSSIEKRYVDIKNIDGKKYRSSYSLIKDDKFKPLGILNLPYVEDDTYYDGELHNFWVRLVQVYGFMLLVAFAVAYFLSTYITKSLKTISDKLNETSLTQKNEKIVLEANSNEINLLIKAYNRMVDELEQSAQKLAQSEREEAWREMAKQVAHEIKNPLTPMKLSIQYLQQYIKSGAQDVSAMVVRVSETLLEQIDGLTKIATEFSNFGTMPKAENEKILINDLISLVHDLFRKRDDIDIYLVVPIDEFYVYCDKNQIIRVLNNIINNAIQAIPEHRRGKIDIELKRKNMFAQICIKDNGIGISAEMKDKVFLPNFTTKNSGTGLGLAMCQQIIESQNGKIYFESNIQIGTQFFIEIPLMRSEEELK